MKLDNTTIVFDSRPNQRLGIRFDKFKDTNPEQCSNILVSNGLIQLGRDSYLFDTKVGKWVKIDDEQFIRVIGDL